MSEQYVIFTDLDGTLLDHDTYEWHPADAAIGLLKRLLIPIIINTSKTRSEVNDLHSEMNLDMSPFVVENGSAIVFKQAPMGLINKIKNNKKYHFIDGFHTYVFGIERDELCQWLLNIRSKYNFSFESYQDWSIDTIMDKTGLPKEKALASQKKEYSEPFIWNGTDDELCEFISLAEKSGYSILKGGRFYHLQGRITKATAYTFINQYQSDLYPESNTLKYIALGDNYNDVDMLNQADLAICIKSPVNDFPEVNNPSVIYSREYGPKGWNTELLNLLKTKN